MIFRQLTLWDLSVDLAAKIREEKKNKVEVSYHFCGVSIPMTGPGGPRW